MAMHSPIVVRLTEHSMCMHKCQVPACRMQEADSSTQLQCIGSIEWQQAQTCLTKTHMRQVAKELDHAPGNRRGPGHRESRQATLHAVDEHVLMRHKLHGLYEPHVLS